MFDRHRQPGEHAVAIDALAGHAVEPLGNVDPLELERGAAAGRHPQGLAAIAEAVGGELVAVAGDVEEDVLIGKARLIDGRDAGAIGVVPDLVHGAQLNERHAAAGGLVDHADGEVLAGGGRGRERREQGHKRGGAQGARHGGSQGDVP